ncbi:MAG: hypothetical protein KJ666_02370 [Bacteroidetes bacterium]|nr:hypothetical protein [Bacteroidota bacterium]MBU2583862.1 hypothetical protein [Bacteroidota bacterium]
MVKVVKKIKLKESNNDFNYWQTKSYEERLITLEEIRQEFNSWKYSDEQRFQRVYTIVKR